MKKLFMALVLTVAVSGQVSAGDLTHLSCSEKYNTLTITEVYGVVYINKEVVENVVKGSPYLAGSVSTVASAEVAAQVTKTKNVVTLTFEDGKTATITLVPKSKGMTELVVASADEGIKESLNSLLGKTIFLTSDACSIK